MQESRFSVPGTFVSPADQCVVLSQLFFHQVPGRYPILTAGTHLRDSTSLDLNRAAGAHHAKGGETMSQSDPLFSMLDEATIAAAELRRDPYDFAYVEQALSPRLKDEVLADAPEIPDRGSYGLPSLRYGPDSGRSSKTSSPSVSGDWSRRNSTWISPPTRRVS